MRWVATITSASGVDRPTGACAETHEGLYKQLALYIAEQIQQNPPQDDDYLASLVREGKHRLAVEDYFTYNKDLHLHVAPAPWVGTD